jgi:hypothetical protein
MALVGAEGVWIVDAGVALVLAPLAVLVPEVPAGSDLRHGRAIRGGVAARLPSSEDSVPVAE